MNMLFVGDSLTRGYDVPYGEGWVELLIKDIKKWEALQCQQRGVSGQSPWILRNAGVDGATLQAIYNTLQRICEDSTKYNLIFLMGGTNDILHGRTAEDCLHIFKKSVAYIQAYGAKPVLGIPPHIDFDPDGDNAVVKAYGELIVEFAAEVGIEVINFYETLMVADARKEIIFAGDVHPNTLGYYYMYKAAWPVIERNIL